MPKQKKNGATAASATKVADTDAACDVAKDSGGPDQHAEKLQSTLDLFLEFERNQEVVRKTQSEILARLEKLESLQELADSQTVLEQKIRELQLATTMYQEAQSDTERQIENLQCDLAIEQQKTGSLQQQVDELRNHSAASGGAANPVASVENSEPLEETDAWQPVDTAQDESNEASDSSSDAWEQQKIALMKKYDSNNDSEMPLNKQSVGADQAESNLEPEPDDHFDIKRLNVSEIDEPVMPVENISAINDHPQQSGERDFTVADREVREQQKKAEIEQSLERARISRQRKALQEKILAMQMESTDSSKNKPQPKKNLLSRMAQFLKRDEVESSSESRIDNLVKLVDSIHHQDTDEVVKYDDPRDQIFAENSHLSGRSDDAPVEPDANLNETMENGIEADNCDTDESSLDSNLD